MAFTTNRQALRLGVCALVGAAAATPLIVHISRYVYDPIMNFFAGQVLNHLLSGLIPSLMVGVGALTLWGVIIASLSRGNPLRGTLWSLGLGSSLSIAIVVIAFHMELSNLVTHLN